MAPIRENQMTSPVDQVTLRRRGAGLIAHDPARAGDGYTLIAPQTGGGAVHLVAMDGTVAHSGRCPTGRAATPCCWQTANLGYNGNLPDTPDHYGAWMLWHGGAFIEATPDGKIVWEYTDPLHHHDAQWLPNGNLLYGAMAPVSREFGASHRRRQRSARHAGRDDLGRRRQGGEPPGRDRLAMERPPSTSTPPTFRSTRRSTATTGR